MITKLIQGAQSALSAVVALEGAVPGPAVAAFEPGPACNVRVSVYSTYSMFHILVITP